LQSPGYNRFKIDEVHTSERDAKSVLVNEGLSRVKYGILLGYGEIHCSETISIIVETHCLVTMDLGMPIVAQQ
jgi:hypothetical protein